MTVGTDSSGYDPTLMDVAATQNKYGGIGTEESSSSWDSGPSLKFDTTGAQAKMIRGGGVLRDFYYNGPSTDAWDFHSAEQNQQDALVALWSDPIKGAVLNNYASLLDKYGHTNSPGTLFALAQSGLDTKAEAIQSMLRTDAAAYSQSYNSLMPAANLSIHGQMQMSEGEDDDSSAWAPVQWASRNLLSAAMMPLQAVQGYVRNAGGILSDDDMDAGDKAKMLGVNYLSMLPPLAAVLDGSVVEDDAFENPWEQTDSGQSLIAGGAENPWAAFNPLNPAYGKQQAGLDYEAAQTMLETDPRYAGVLAGVNLDQSQLNPALEKIAQDNELYGNPGWFIDETSPIGEAQRKATYNSWAIPGPQGSMTAWTFGRGITSSIAGPDWSGYGVTSGLIDAVASIAGDPTIWGGKFGVVSKSLRGIGMLADNAGMAGAELALTVGKEAKAVRNGVGVTAKNSQLFLKDYNRLVDSEWKLIKGNRLTPEDWAALSLDEQALAIKMQKQAAATERAIQQAIPDQRVVMQRARSVRRAAAQAWRGGVVEAEAGVDAARMTRTVELLQESMDASRVARKQNGSYFSHSRFQTWADNLSPEDRELWDEQAKAMNRLKRQKKFKLDETDPNYSDNLTALFIEHYTNEVATAGGRGPVSQYAGQADAAAAQLYLNEGANEALTELARIDTAGVTLVNAPVKGEFQRSVYGASDGPANDALTVWTRDTDPKLADGFATVPMPQLTTIFKRLTEILSNSENKMPKIGVAAGERGQLPDQVAAKIRDYENPLKSLEEAFRAESMTYNQLLLNLAHYGLEGYLDDILRDSYGIDGISSVNRTSRKGVWMGDHPSLETYAFPQNAMKNAEAAAGSLDTADFLSKIPATAQRIDVRSLSRDGAAALTATSKAAMKRARQAQLTENRAVVQQARAAQVSLDKEVADLDVRFADPTRTLKETLYHEAGITSDPARGVSMTPAGMRWFLFGGGTGTGKLRERALTALSNFVSDEHLKRFKGLKPDTPEWAKAWDEVAPDYLGQLHQVTGMKWAPETYNEVLRNVLVTRTLADGTVVQGGGVDGLIAVLAPHLGVDVGKGSIQRGLKVIESDGVRSLQSFRTPSSAAKRAAARAAGVRPGSRVVEVKNTRDVTDAVVKYGMYAKLPIAEINRLVGRAIAADGQFGSVPTNVDVLKDLFDAVGVKLLDNIAESNLIFKGERGQMRLKELQSAMRESTEIFRSGATGVRNDIKSRVAGGDITFYSDDLGNRVDYPNAQLDSELLTGMIHLPSVDEWQAGMGRLAASIHRFSPVERVYDIARSIYDNFFRTSLLVFRVSYVIRNSAEMQIRLFLNGHHSIFSDPATLVGMTLGNFMRKGDESGGFLAESFAPYRNTVYDTAFEVGDDKALAFTNHAENYFGVTRESHSLTDPRVYQSSIYKGWQKINVHAPQFAAGWANELIMLHHSDVARVVSGVPVRGFARVHGEEHMDYAVRWIRSDDVSARQVRERLIASDPAYATIFDSESMTMDYLFTNPNSIKSRITKYTMDDPTLVEFVKTGTWMGDDVRKTVTSMPELSERVNFLRGMLHSRYWNKGEPTPALINHMENSQVMVPWIDGKKLRAGSGFMDAFFSVANKFERLNTVGPEYRMAYWDRIAELAPALNAADVERALEGARTTLSPLQRLAADGKMIDLGGQHPAWKALDKAKKENTDGYLTLDELHAVATDYAAAEVKKLFYDAANRNNFWTATRLLFPFGQAWGNTVRKWTELGAKHPAQVYKAQKALLGASQNDSSAIYDMGSGWMFGDYEEGMAPWDNDPNGGFFYNDTYGDTAFMMPFVGRAASVPVNMLSKMNGFNANVSTVDMSANTTSMNLALGSESIAPGTSFLVPMGLSMFPDNKVIEQINVMTNPYGPRDVRDSALPAWSTAFLAGLGSIPIVGDAVGDFLSPLSASQKNKNVRDAVAILSASGGYDLTDPLSVRQLQDDANNLAPTLLLVSGVFKNILPTSPTQQLAIDTSSDGFEGNNEPVTGTLASFAMINNIYRQNVEEAAGDEAEAKEQLVRDFGPAFMFAVTGNKEGYSRIPSSDAKQWATSSPENLELARAYLDYFPMFFPKGDPTDLTSRLWMDEQSGRKTTFKNAEDIIDENIMWMMRVQKQRVQFMLSNGLINKDQAAAANEDIKTTYEGTAAGLTFNSMTTDQELVQIRQMFEASPSLQKTPAGRGFAEAMSFRDQALAEVRSRTGDESSTLKRKDMTPIREAYLTDLKAVLSRYPDFQTLYMMLEGEWA